MKYAINSKGLDALDAELKQKYDTVMYNEIMSIILSHAHLVL